MSDRIVMSLSSSGTTWSDQVVFTINGRDLRDLVGTLARHMTGPPSSVIVDHPDHLLGGPDRWEIDSWHEDPAVLGCACGQPGCAAVLVHITVERGVVEWSDFRRDRDNGGIRLGPYRFSRKQYEAQVERLLRAGRAAGD